MSDDTPLALVAALRDRGVAVRTDAVATFIHALASLDLGRAGSLYWAGRLTLVRHHDDLRAYDAAFLRFVAGTDRLDAAEGSEGSDDEEALSVARPASPVAVAVPPPIGDVSTDQDDVDDRTTHADPPAVAGVAERLAGRDFAACSEQELGELGRAVDRIRWTTPVRRSRRLRRGGTAVDRLDLRRTAAAALRTDGELLDHHHRSRATAPRRVVLLLDVSGSMEPYVWMLLRFGHAAIVGGRRTEVFTIGTRLTRVTSALAVRDPDRALAAAADVVADWSGGTRLAGGVGRFVDDWGRRGMARGAEVVILSDGWERGDPSELGERMRQLHLLAHRIIWVNPLRASPGYRPLAGGMAAALPFVDDFVDGHSLRSLVELAAVIGREGTRPRSGPSALPARRRRCDGDGRSSTGGPP